jgi:hypothetical protein
MPPPAPGAPLPDLKLQAAVSGREVSKATLAGRRAVLVVHGSRSTDAAKEVSKAVRARFKPAEVALASIVDLRSFGGLWRRVAEAQVKSNYDKLAAKVKEADAAADPADWVVICPDWDGSASLALGVAKPDDEPAVIVAGPDGKVLGTALGSELGAKAMALLG